MESDIGKNHIQKYEYELKPEWQYAAEEALLNAVAGLVEIFFSHFDEDLMKQRVEKNRCDEWKTIFISLQLLLRLIILKDRMIRNKKNN